MKYNKEILLNWGRSIEDLPRLKLDEACSLYETYLKEIDVLKKAQIREQLITGTLYIVYKYLRKSNLDKLLSSSYDMGDIIDSCVEYLIKLIDEGNLLNINTFRNIFNTYPFYTYLTNCLVKGKFLMGEETLITTNNFANIIEEIKDIVNKKGNLSYEDYLKIINNNKLSKRHINELCSYTYILLREIIDNEDINSLSKAKINMLKHLLIDSIFEYELNDQLEDRDNMEDNLLKEDYYQRILEIVFNTKSLSIDDKNIILQRYGLGMYTGASTLEAVAKSKGVTREYIRQRETKILRKIRCNSKIKQFLRGNI